MITIKLEEREAKDFILLEENLRELNFSANKSYSKIT
jgi:hypothetical protein